MASTNTTQASRVRKPKSSIRLSKAGYEFDINESRWQLDANTSLNLDLFAQFNLVNKFETNLVKMLADYSSEYSSSYVRTIQDTLINLFRTGVKNEIKEEHIVNFKSKLDDTTEYRLGYIRGFILDWEDRDGLTGVSKNAAELLKSMTISGNQTGNAVALNCPFSGAYTYDEQTDFIHWYVDAYTNDEIDLKEYAFIMALQQTGARPIQISHLYCKDLILKRNSSGVDEYDLHLPAAKKRQGFRKVFQEKDGIGEDLFLVLSRQAAASITFLEKQFKTKLTDKQRADVPIFINKSQISALGSYEAFKNIQQKTPDLLCMLKQTYSQLVSRIARICPLKTARIELNGEYGDLHINARRFRYTHATNLAMTGANKYVIAEELGHAHTGYVGVYTEFTEEVAESLDDALTPSLTPLAQAFSGTLIDSEKQAARANDPRSRIHNNGGNPVGNCGEFGFCANGVIHCYTCVKFQPWVNAPHDKVLKSVEKDRDWKKEMGASEFVLQGHNRSINAIKIVIQQCEERKVEMKKEASFNG